MSEEKVIEIKFDSSKEKIFILPADLIESIKVIRDIKEEANSYEKLANELKFKRTFEK